MGLSVMEQETTVNFYRDSDICTVYTSDSTIMTRLDKLAENPKAPYWKLIKEERNRSGDVVGKTYETHKRLISFRADISKRELTDEERAEIGNRLKSSRVD